MEAKDPKNSVRNEQFSNPAENSKKETDDSKNGSSAENSEKKKLNVSDEKEDEQEESAIETGKESESKPVDSSSDSQNEEPGPEPGKLSPDSTKDPVKSDEKDTSIDKSIPRKQNPDTENKQSDATESSQNQAKENTEATDDESSASESEENDAKKEDADKEPQGSDIEENSDNQAVEKPKDERKEEVGGGSEEKPGDESKDKPGDDSEKELDEESEEKRKEILKRQQAEKKKEIINYSLLKKPDLLEIFKELLDEGRINEIGPDVAAIKSSFYKQYKAEVEEKKQNFLSQGGNEQDFSSGYSEEEETLKSLLKKYNDLRSEFNKLREEEKDENLKMKYEIIEEIKDLVHRDESINKTFQEFRDLQRRWHEVGIVPQSELKNLWETYHYHVEKFYDYIKINKELRDLDLKKNLEAKLNLCEKAEELLLEPNIVNAFKTLQKFHDQWREIGPVPKENRSEIWERFREATSKINKKHQQYYQDLKDTQRKNLESKTLLCEKAETLADLELNEHEEWVEKTREILDIQKVWKTIGFAPKKDNNRIYARFRAACDKFFDKKRDFYAQGMEQQQENLQKKLDLCVQAEALQDSTDWKKTTDELINLQKKWKKIGPVPRKKSDVVWKRFRAACDKFFNRKSDFFSNIEETYEKNLADKEELIKEIQEFEPGDSLKENLSKLNEFQRRWSGIGFVPYEKKDEVMQNYRDSINEKYDQLNMDEHKKNVLKFQNKLDAIKNKPRPENKLRFERDKLMNKLQQLRNDIVVWENNIGFFAESKNADSMVRDFEKKIENAKKKIKLLEDKISMIDEMDEQI